MAETNPSEREDAAAAAADDEALLAAWAARAGDEDAAWAAARPGPSLDAVAVRLSRVPRAFLDDAVSVQALSGDVLGGDVLGGDVLGRPLAASAHAADARVRRGAALGLWLVASEEVDAPFVPSLRAGNPALAIDALALRVAPVAEPLDWLFDQERREEAVRTFLLWCGYLPAGEDRDVARSLLDARDSLRRHGALAEAYAAHRHREAVARRLAEARAREAAARYSHE